MNKGLMKFDWGHINEYTEEEITYFLFLEGKSIESIARIRNIDRGVVQKQIIDGKIKYRFFAKSKDISELFKTICSAGKDDKLLAINSLDSENRDSLIRLIRNGYSNFNLKEKETAIWILGELKSVSCLDILVKASVNKYINIRRMAVSAMGKIQDKGAEAALIRALNDDNPQVILYAIKALSKLKSIRAKDKIYMICNDIDCKSYLKKAAEDYFEVIR